MYTTETASDFASFRPLVQWWRTLHSKWQPTVATVETHRLIQRNRNMDGWFVLGYSYWVHDQVYSGEWWKPIRWLGVPDEAVSETARQFPIGTKLNVRFDPARPECSYMTSDLGRPSGD